MLAEMATIADLKGAHIPERPGHGFNLANTDISCDAMSHFRLGPREFAVISHAQRSAGQGGMLWGISHAVGERRAG